MFSTLIAAAELGTIHRSASVRIVDCRFNLAEPCAGFAGYKRGHIKGSVYAHLERDLSGPRQSGNGRHPLPTPAQMVETFACLGLNNRDQIVIYDDANGMVASRVWWMLRYLGHGAVAVLDGGLAAWTTLGLPLEAGEETAQRSDFAGEVIRERLVRIDEIGAGLELVDARDPRRFRGEIEPLDPRAGHIPGAHNHFYINNLDSTGCFRSPAALRQAFNATLGTLPTSATVHYCGSGVSACHNILAQLHAGLAEPRLYCGSWSEWCADPDRPAAVGTAP